MDSQFWVVSSVLIMVSLSVAFLSIVAINNEIPVYVIMTVMSPYIPATASIFGAFFNVVDSGASVSAVISMGSTAISIGSAIIAVISLSVAIWEMQLARKSLTIAEKMQETDKTREEEDERLNTTYVVPHAINSLKRLFASMASTENMILEHISDDKIKSYKQCKELHKRARAHIAAIWQIESIISEARLPEYYEHLGSVIAYLEELEFATPDTEIDMVRFKHNVEAVIVVIRDIERYGQKAKNSEE